VQAPATPVKFTNVNVMDRQILADYLQSAEGSEVHMNWIRDNADSVRTVLG
jgi:hypothetical protein